MRTLKGQAFPVNIFGVFIIIGIAILLGGIIWFLATTYYAYKLFKKKSNPINFSLPAISFVLLFLVFSYVFLFHFTYGGYLIMGDPSMCGEDTGCIEKLAIYKSDPSICRFNKNNVDYEDCLKEVALAVRKSADASDDAVFCDRLPDMPLEECYQYYLTDLKNKSECYNIPIESYKERCILTASYVEAYLSNDIEKCPRDGFFLIVQKQLHSIEGIYYCADRSSNESIFANFDYCALRVISKDRHSYPPEQCNYIVNSSIRDSCFGFFAVALRDPALCPESDFRLYCGYDNEIRTKEECVERASGNS